MTGAKCHLARNGFQELPDLRGRPSPPPPRRCYCWCMALGVLSSRGKAARSVGAPDTENLSSSRCPAKPFPAVIFKGGAWCTHLLHVQNLKLHSLSFPLFRKCTGSRGLAGQRSRVWQKWLGGGRSLGKGFGSHVPKGEPDSGVAHMVPGRRVGLCRAAIRATRIGQSITAHHWNHPTERKYCIH